MPVACPNCGAHNVDGSAFCGACGRPLTGAFAYPPPSKLPWIVLIAGILALIGALTLVAAVFLRHPAAPAPAAQPFPTAQSGIAPPATPVARTPVAVSTPQAATATSVTGLQPTSLPTRAASALPATPPAAPATSGSGSGGTSAQNDVVQVQVPNGWTKSADSDANDLFLDPPSDSPLDGYLYLLSGFLKAPESAAQWLQGVLTNRRQDAPDAKVCQDQQPLTEGGVAGTYVGLCYTRTPQNGRAFQAVEWVWAGTSADQTVIYEVSVNTTPDGADAFLDAVNPILHTIVWKLR